MLRAFMRSMIGIGVVWLSLLILGGRPLGPIDIGLLSLLLCALMSYLYRAGSTGKVPLDKPFYVTDKNMAEVRAHYRKLAVFSRKQCPICGSYLVSWKIHVSQAVATDIYLSNSVKIHCEGMPTNAACLRSEGRPQKS